MFNELNKSCENIYEELKGILFAHGFVLLQIGVEITTVAKFLDDVIVIAGLHHVKQLDHVGTLEFLHDLDLTDQTLPQIVVTFL